MAPCRPASPSLPPRRPSLLPPRLSATPMDAVQGTHGVVISWPSPVGSCVPPPSSWSSDARADPAAFLYSSRLEHLPLNTTFVFCCCFTDEHRPPPRCFSFASRLRPRERLQSLGFDKLPSTTTFTMYIYTEMRPPRCILMSPNTREHLQDDRRVPLRKYPYARRRQDSFGIHQVPLRPETSTPDA